MNVKGTLAWRGVLARSDFAVMEDDVDTVVLIGRCGKWPLKNELASQIGMGWGMHELFDGASESEQAGERIARNRNQ